MLRFSYQVGKRWRNGLLLKHLDMDQTLCDNEHCCLTVNLVVAEENGLLSLSHYLEEKLLQKFYVCFWPCETGKGIFHSQKLFLKDLQSTAQCLNLFPNLSISNFRKTDFYQATSNVQVLFQSKNRVPLPQDLCQAVDQVKKPTKAPGG